MQHHATDFRTPTTPREPPAQPGEGTSTIPRASNVVCQADRWRTHSNGRPAPAALTCARLMRETSTTQTKTTMPVRLPFPGNSKAEAATATEIRRRYYPQWQNQVNMSGCILPHRGRPPRMQRCAITARFAMLPADPITSQAGCTRHPPFRTARKMHDARTSQFNEQRGTRHLSNAAPLLVPGCRINVHVCAAASHRPHVVESKIPCVRSRARDGPAATTSCAPHDLVLVVKGARGVNSWVPGAAKRCFGNPGILRVPLPCPALSCLSNTRLRTMHWVSPESIPRHKRSKTVIVPPPRGTPKYP